MLAAGLVGLPGAFLSAQVPSASPASQASEKKTYLGLFIQGNKIGYSSYSSEPSSVAGQSLTKSDGYTLMDTGLLGVAMKIVMSSSTWTTSAGKTVRMTFSMSSGGRSQKVDARFSGTKVVADIDNSGNHSQKTLTVPPDGQVVDDPLTLVTEGKLKPGVTRSFYVLDPTTVSFVKNDVKVIGKSETTVKGKTVQADLIEVSDPRATMRVFVNATGDLVRAEGPAGIEMYPISRSEALGKSVSYKPSVDLAFATSIKPDKPITDPAHLSELKLRITGRDLTNIPSGDYQSVQKDGDAWIVDIHPTQIAHQTGDGGETGEKIFQARAEKPDWDKPSMNIPSGSARFVALAKKIVGDRTDVHSAAFAIRQYVFDTMRPNAGIGVLRDANEVLDTKEGVCRDYAVLTVTLLRAAGIPARLASGIVNWDGTFYYHAWAEAWDGKHWIGIDSTSDDNQVSAAHVKLGEGNVEEAFAFTFLDKAKIAVLAAH
jgi:hypothetical protein